MGSVHLHLVVVMVFTCLYSATCHCPDCKPKKRYYDDAWEKYKADYNKVYANNSDECSRRLMWEDNVKLIEQFNLPSSGARGYKIGLNEFSDWSATEISTRLTGFLPPPVETAVNKPASRPITLGKSGQDFLNYTALGYVTPVKKQDCGNCYAYAAVGAMEGQLFKNTGKLVEISTQNIVDCCISWIYGIEGCIGGNAMGAFSCNNDIGGFVANDIYPPMHEKKNCSIPAGNYTRYLCKGVEILGSNDEAALKKAVETVGPIACAMHAYKSLTFSHYKGGVFSDLSCGTTVDHVVLITGFGTTPDGVKYWIAKNSWGTDWGENGNFQILRDVNLCGIATLCTYPTGCIAV